MGKADVGKIADRQLAKFIRFKKYREFSEVELSLSSLNFLKYVNMCSL